VTGIRRQVLTLRTLLLGLLLRCPACGQGRLFRTAYALHPKCAGCGVVFEPDPGEMAGGMAVNMVLTSILGVAWAIYGAVFSGLNMAIVVAALMVGTLAFGLVFHRHARGLWVAFLYLTGDVGAGERYPSPPNAARRATASRAT
jgi:uncharacterized protein (DUF983 family)